MKKLITLVAVVFSTFLFAQNNQYQQGMEKAFALWKDKKNTEAKALFERIATIEKNNWLPDYYASFINCLDAFDPVNSSNANALIEKAQNLLNNAITKSGNNSELHVLQAMIYTATLIQDPMTNGMKYSMLAKQEYAKAKAIDPNNPRAVLGEAEFDLGSAKYTGMDTKVICKEIEKSMELFTNFKPVSPFHPKWGEDRAKELLANCN